MSGKIVSVPVEAKEWKHVYKHETQGRGKNLQQLIAECRKIIRAYVPADE